MFVFCLCPAGGGADKGGGQQRAGPGRYGAPAPERSGYGKQGRPLGERDQCCSGATVLFIAYYTSGCLNGLQLSSIPELLLHTDRRTETEELSKRVKTPL